MIYMTLHKKISSLILVLSLIFLSSCKKNNEDGNGANADVIPSKLTIGMYSPESYNPLNTTTDYNSQAYLLVFDSLFNINEKFEAEKNLASDISIENGGNTVVIQIKPNVKFHNGASLTAEDVTETIEYIIKNGGYYSYNVRNIEKAKAVNDYTLKLTLKYHTPNIDKQLTFPIVSRKTPDDLNGTGPYKLKSEKKGKQLELVKFDDYHADFNSEVTNIEITLIPDKMTARSLSGSGILDIFFAAYSDEGLKTVTKTESVKRDYLTDSYTFLKLNFDNPMLSLKAFRKAINIGINREKIATDVYMSHAESTALPIPSSASIYNPACSYNTKTDEATKLLMECGYQDTDSDGVCEYTGFSLEDDESPLPENPIFGILTTDDPSHISIAESLREDFKKMGLILNIEAYPREEYLNRYSNGKYDICLLSTDCGLDLDTTAFLGNGGVFSADIDYSFENALSKLSATAITELKAPTYANLFSDFYENPNHIPIAFLKNTLITNDKFKNFDDVYLNNIYYKILLGKKN